MITPTVMLIVWLGLILSISIVARLLSERHLRKLRASGIYPEKGRESEADVERLKRAGEMVFAVRCYRAVHHVGLADAHAAVFGRRKKRVFPVIFLLLLIHLVIVAYVISRR